MVARQLRDRGIADERVLAAMGAVPREVFVPRGPAPSLRGRGPADRGRPDDQPAVHGRQDDRGPRRPARATGSSRSAPAPATRRRSWPGSARRSPRSNARRRSSRRARARSTPCATAWPARSTIREADGSLGDPAGAPWDGIIVTAAAPASRRRSATSCATAAGSSSRSGRATASADRGHPARRRLARASPTAPASSSRSSVPAASTVSASSRGPDSASP